eukprot:1056931-Rhodomonas_salina.1
MARAVECGLVSALLDFVHALPAFLARRCTRISSETGHTDADPGHLELDSETWLLLEAVQVVELLRGMLLHGGLLLVSTSSDAPAPDSMHRLSAALADSTRQLLLGLDPDETAGGSDSKESTGERLLRSVFAKRLLRACVSSLAALLAASSTLLPAHTSPAAAPSLPPL